jgi:hypothetical protein
MVLVESATPQPPSPNKGSAKSFRLGCWACLLVLGLFIVIGCCFGPINQQPHNHRNGYVQSAHALGLALFAYANDNSGLYPDGTSSTEVCQQLLSGGYILDPTIFYVPMEGKTKAAYGQKKLRPDNVCWDVTGGGSLNDNASLPLIFLTGYRFTYAPGGGFTPLTPFPRYETLSSDSGLAAYFMNNSCAWLLPSSGAATSMEHFLPADFNAHGKTYHQLTPDGVLR